MNATTFHGIAHGRTIELECESGLPEGQPVRVTVISSPIQSESEKLARLKSAAGGWNDDDIEGLNRFLEWNRQQRKVQRREIPA